MQAQDTDAGLTSSVMLDSLFFFVLLLLQQGSLGSLVAGSPFQHAGQLLLSLLHIEAPVAEIPPEKGLVLVPIWAALESLPQLCQCLHSGDGLEMPQNLHSECIGALYH